MLKISLFQIYSYFLLFSLPLSLDVCTVYIILTFSNMENSIKLIKSEIGKDLVLLNILISISMKNTKKLSV